FRVTGHRGDLDARLLDRARRDHFERARVRRRIRRVARYEEDLLDAGLRELAKRRTQGPLTLEPSGDNVGRCPETKLLNLDSDAHDIVEGRLGSVCNIDRDPFRKEANELRDGLLIH